MGCQSLNLTQIYSNEWGQFLARLSDHKVSGLSHHNRNKNRLELKGLNEDDLTIFFEIGAGWNTHVKDGNIGFR